MLSKDLKKGYWRNKDVQRIVKLLGKYLHTFTGGGGSQAKKSSGCTVQLQV